MSNPNTSYEHRMRGCPGNYRQAADDRITALEAENKEISAALNEFDSYNGHLAWMDKHYPLDVPYFAEGEDVGCQVMRLSRKVMEVEAERDRLDRMQTAFLGKERDEIRNELFTRAEQAERERDTTQEQLEKFVGATASFGLQLKQAEAESAELRRKLTSTEMARKVECDAKFKCWDFIRDHGLGAEFYALTHFAFAKGCDAPSARRRGGPMSVLDKLREAVQDTPSWRMTSLSGLKTDTLAAIDKFGSEHPGLVDLTEECEKCHAKFAGGDGVVMFTKFNGTTLRTTFCKSCAATTNMNEWYGLDEDGSLAGPPDAKEE